MSAFGAFSRKKGQQGDSDVGVGADGEERIILSADNWKTDN